MEPGHEDREYILRAQEGARDGLPQWSPVMKTGNTRRRVRRNSPCSRPQWSPVMKTGNTAMRETGRNGYQTASMEPGHEDREYRRTLAPPAHPQRSLNGARS